MYQVQQIANLVPKVLSFALDNTIFAGVVDIFKYPRHQLIINEAANSRITFVFAAIIFSSSPPLFLAPRFWEPRDQLQPGFFLEARERNLGKTFSYDLKKCVSHLRRHPLRSIYFFRSLKKLPISSVILKEN